MKIYLIRHGETDWNLQGKLQGREDIPLNQTGILQATACGKALKLIRLQSIQTSPLLRAKETARIIAVQQQCPIIVNPELIERDYGRLSGLTPQERQHFEASGESAQMELWETLAERALAAVEKIADAFSEDTAAVVSHGAWINALLAVLSGHEIGSGKTRLKNACISRISKDKGHWKIDFYNLAAHEITEYIQEHEAHKQS